MYRYVSKIIYTYNFELCCPECYVKETCTFFHFLSNLNSCLFWTPICFSITYILFNFNQNSSNDGKIPRCLHAYICLATIIHWFKRSLCELPTNTPNKISSSFNCRLISNFVCHHFRNSSQKLHACWHSVNICSGVSSSCLQKVHNSDSTIFILCNLLFNRSVLVKTTTVDQSKVLKIDCSVCFGATRYSCNEYETLREYRNVPFTGSQR